MKKIVITFCFCLTLLVSNSQKILRTLRSELYSQLSIDPDIQKLTQDYNYDKPSRIFAIFKNGDRYAFSFFTAKNDKLYAMTLSCQTDEKTTIKFSEEISRRSAATNPSGGYIYYDEKGRGIYLWLTTDDLGRKVINYEAKFPFDFD